MKLKNFLSIAMTCTFLFTLSPLNLTNKNVQAADEKLEIESYNNSNTVIGNKYEILGTVYSAKQYTDCILVLTDKGLYQIKNGNVTKQYFTGIQKNSVVYKLNSSDSIAPYYNNKYSILNVTDLQQNNINEDFVENYIPLFDKSYKPLEVVLDTNGNMCFSTVEISDNAQVKEYKLINVNKNGILKETGKSDSAFTNISFDKNNNVWFKTVKSKVANEGTENKCILGKVSESGEVTFIDLNASILNYKIATDGSLWAISENKIIHSDNNGNIIKSYDGSNLKAIDIDSEDNVWVNDNGSIRKLEDDLLVEKYKTTADKTNLSVYKEGKLIASSTAALTIVDGGNIEEIDTRSVIEKNAVVLNLPSEDGKYGSTTVKILSGYEDYSEDNTPNNLSVRLTEKKRDGKFVSTYIPNDKKIDITHAVAYNKDIYVPLGKKIYKLTDKGFEEYTKLNLTDNIEENINDLKVDGYGNFVVIGNLSIYKLNKDGITSLVDINAIKKNFSLPEDSTIKKLFADESKNIYLMMTYKNEKGEPAFKILNINDLNKISDGTPKVDNYRFVNAFTNESGSIEYVFYSFNEKKNVVGTVFGTTFTSDKRFDKQEDNFYEKCADINSLKVTDKKICLMIMDNTSLYMKQKDDTKFVKYSSSSYINNLAQDDYSGVYVGSYGGEVLYFK